MAKWNYLSGDGTRCLTVYKAGVSTALALERVVALVDPEVAEAISFKTDLQLANTHYLIAGYTPPEQLAVSRRQAWRERTSALKNFLFSGTIFSQVPDAVAAAGLWVPSRTAEIVFLGVITPHRNSRIGELLLINLIEIALKEKCTHIKLEARVSSKVARELYSKYLFEQIGTREKYYDSNAEDAVVMQVQMNTAQFADNLKLRKDRLNANWQLQP